MQARPATPLWMLPGSPARVLTRWGGLLGLTLMITAAIAVAQTDRAPAKATPSSAAGVPSAAQRAGVVAGVPSAHRAAVLEMSQMPKPLAGPVDPQIAAALKNVSAARVKATVEKLVSFGTRLTIAPADPQTIASGKGIGAARAWIKAEFERYSQACGGCLEVRTDSFVEQPQRRIPKPTELVNVYAIQRGADPVASKRIVLVTGHYDSRPSNVLDVEAQAPGANDDGSGTAVSLECARVLSRLKFPATIIYLTVAGEEQGLNGSRHFAQMAKKEGWNIEAVLNNDIVGGDRSPGQDPHVVRVFSEGIPIVDVGRPAAPARPATSSEAAIPAQEAVPANTAAITRLRAIGGESDSSSRELARYLRQTGAQYLPRTFQPMLVFRPDRYLRGGDHTSFNQSGFAAVRVTEYRENYNHQHQNVRTENGIEYGDLPKFVDYEYLASVARLNAATLASLASAPAPPANVRLETRNLENDSTVMWDVPEGAENVKYEVLWRPTTSPDWERAVMAGSVRQFTLPDSKDNVIFAVRALDAKGHRSVAAVAAGRAVRPEGAESPER